uniref:Uncharacterized protein n=1 Tax=Meloidogyne javanica TaxID=6303 RepID=A0A915MA98_MELJA
MGGLNTGRVGFASSLNFVIVVINVVLFFLNLLNATIYRMERLYSVIGVILFIIAFGIMIWYLIEYEIGRNQLIGATVLIGVQMVLFIWDYQILHEFADYTNVRELISYQTLKKWEVYRGIDKKLIEDLEIKETEMAEIEGINYAKKCFDKKKKFIEKNENNSNRVLDVKKFLDTFATIKGNYLISTDKEKFGNY